MGGRDGRKGGWKHEQNLEVRGKGRRGGRKSGWKQEQNLEVRGKGKSAND